MGDTTTIKLAIDNLELLSSVLEKKAGEDYNSDYGYYLDQLSFSMRQHASELRELNYQLGGI